VRQEAWGYLCAHCAIRALAATTVACSGVDPGRISFTRALNAARRSVRQGLGTAAHLLMIVLASSSRNWKLEPKLKN
jgi:hypothetical protein